MDSALKEGGQLILVPAPNGAEAFPSWSIHFSQKLLNAKTPLGKQHCRNLSCHVCKPIEELDGSVKEKEKDNLAVYTSYRLLAASATFIHSHLLCVFVLHSVTLHFCRSNTTSSSHLHPGCPGDHLPKEHFLWCLVCFHSFTVAQPL